MNKAKKKRARKPKDHMFAYIDDSCIRFKISGPLNCSWAGDLAAWLTRAAAYLSERSEGPRSGREREK